MIATRSRAGSGWVWASIAPGTVNSNASNRQFQSKLEQRRERGMFFNFLLKPEFYAARLPSRTHVISSTTLGP
jgi:hypothetical protein